MLLYNKTMVLSHCQLADRVISHRTTASPSSNQYHLPQKEDVHWKRLIMRGLQLGIDKWKPGGDASLNLDHVYVAVRRRELYLI